MANAILFPGQGAQVVGMGRDVYDKSPAAKAVFDLADNVLGFKLTDIIFSGPEEKLTETDISQPAILTTSLALLAALREMGWKGEAAATAGLSLGEYTALVFAGAISPEDAIALVRKRGTYMREAGLHNPGGMTSVIGLDEAAIAAVLDEAAPFGIIRAANLNCPGQVVLSGDLKALEAAGKAAEARGAMKVVPLKVDGAFHSPLMQEAADRLAADLAAVGIKAPSVPVVANVTADFVSDPEAIRRLLVQQVTSSVLWEKSIVRLFAAGVSTFAEVGPGRVLTGLMKRIDRKAAMTSVSDAASAAAFGNPAQS
jgi:[acyl-carrier-protein] S-malonyltransferase